VNDRHDDERLGRQLGETIARRATSISARPDEAALFARVGAHSVRQRHVLAAVAVVAVVVASITAYAVGATRGDGDASVLTPVASSAPEPSAAPSDGTVGAVEGPLMHVFTRTANGITVRVYTTPHSDNPGASSGDFIAEMSNDAAVGVGRVNCYGMGLRGSGTFGAPEGSPVQWIIVETRTAAGASYDQPGPAGSLVRAEFEGGVDEMVPVGGIAVLVAPGAGGSVDFDGPGVRGSTTIGQPVDTEPGPCSPATLPPAGPQPDDVTAAKAGVRHAYADAYTGSNPANVKWDAIEDGEHLDAVLGERIPQAGRDAGFTDEAIAAMTITIGDIVFTDDTHAALLYDIAIPGYNDAEPPGTLGYAVYIDGRWTVARETHCGHLAQINVVCP